MRPLRRRTHDAQDEELARCRWRSECRRSGSRWSTRWSASGSRARATASAAARRCVELETDKVNLDVTATDDGVLTRVDKQEGESSRSARSSVSSATAQAHRRRPATAPSSAPPRAQAAPSHIRATLPRFRLRSRLQPAPTRTRPADGADAAAARRARRAPAGRGARHRHQCWCRHGPRRPRHARGRPRPGRANQRPPAGAADRRRHSRPRHQSPPDANACPCHRRGSPSPADSRGEERVRMSRRRQTIAARLVEAQQTAAMLTTFNEVDMTAVMEVRKAAKTPSRSATASASASCRSSRRPSSAR